jgi:serine/threonine protein kinase/DNA-binding winged helix-turn-helix (wHTH) protein
MSTARYLDHPYLIAGRRIDPLTGTLSYHGEQKHLRRKELEALALLARAGDSVVPRSVFIEQIWQGNVLVGEAALTDAISSLRRALSDTDRANPLILTIPRRGYQLRASVRLIPRDGGLAFVAGSVVDGRPDWRLKQLLEQTKAQESWLAEDGRSRRIFRFCRNEQELRKLRREAVLMRYLREALADRPDVSTILDWQLEDPPYFLELAAPACGNLRGVMLGKVVPEPPERWRLMLQVAEALAAVHAVGVVHRNLTPDAVLVDRRNGERVALLGEFGLAALQDRARLATLGIDAEGLSLKTELQGPATAYTAPECVAGAPATAASDVYALGVLITQTLRADFEDLECSRFEDFSADLSELLRRCHADAPEERPTAAEVAATLRQVVQPKRTVTPVAVPEAATPVAATPAAPEDPPVIELAAHEQSVEDTPADPVPRDAPTAPESADVGASRAAPLFQLIGRYQILSELAQGGMGVVYLAEQSEPVQRRVALKLIRAGLDSAQVLARFEAERQALAMMNHPNVSAIFDAGATSGGYPYFVMEYVPGKDIKTHCDDAKLNLRARIRLFLQVCDGVLHAHQKGLIHRDLKPSNILVKHAADLPALVKLIDFGIAKSLTGGLGSGLHTRVGSFVGTPVYSSPEQVIDPTREIDTRADLYSLGVVLYELLAGVLPRSAEDLDADTPSELARKIRNTRTPPMGTRYTGLSPDERQRLAELRALSTEGLSMQLGGDLDWIVGKCIAQDPDDRYATVQDLRLDLQRWLDDRPVEARPSSAWYRFRKLVRRNRLNTAIITITAAALVATTSAAVIAQRRAEAARADAVLAAEFQESRYSKIDPATLGLNLRDFLTGMVMDQAKQDPARAADPNQTRKQIEQLLGGVDFTELSLKVLDQAVLDQSLTEIVSHFAGKPELQVQLLHSLGLSWYNLGRLEKSLQAHAVALGISQANFGAVDRRTLLSMEISEHLKLVIISNKNSGIGGVLIAPLEIPPSYPAVIELMQKHLDASDALLPAALNRYSSLLCRAGKFEDCISITRRSLAVLNASFPPDHELTLQALSYLGSALAKTGDRAAANEVLVDALSRLRRVHGDDHPQTIQASSIYSIFLREGGDLQSAAQYSKAAYENCLRVNGRLHPHTVQYAANYASLLHSMGRLQDARALTEQILESRTVIFGTNHARTHVTKLGLALMQIEAGDAAGAIDLLGEFLSANQSMPINSPIEVYYAKLRLAEAFRSLGKLESAAHLLAELRAAKESETPAYSRPRCQLLDSTAQLLDQQGELDKSLSTQREAHDCLAKAVGPSKDVTLLAFSRLADSLRRQGDLTEAAQLSNQLLDQARRALPPEHYLLGVFALVDGQILAAQMRFKEAQSRYREAWEGLRRELAADPKYRVALQAAVGELEQQARRNGFELPQSAEEQQWRAALADSLKGT